MTEKNMKQSRFNWKNRPPEPKRITDSKNIVSDEELASFLDLDRFDGVRDEELIRDILVLSRIYDRNFDRLLAEGNSLKKETYRKIEELINKVSAYMRELAVIGSGERII